MLHKGKPRIFDASVRASDHSRTPSTFTINSNGNPHSTRKTLHSKSTYFYRWGIPSICTLALLFGGIVTINPLLHDNQAYAITDTNNSDASSDDSPSISIAFPTTGLPEGYNNSAEQTTTVTPGVVAYRSNYFDVTVKNPSWYAVSVRAAKGYTSELKNGDTLISGVGKNVTPNNFKENTWGYALTKVDSTSTAIDGSTLQCSTLPNENSTVVDIVNRANNAATTDHYVASFATLLSGDIPSGHYVTKVYLSAVTNPGHVTSAFGPTIMQDFYDNPSACKDAAEGTTAQLTDARDNKVYWVAKLKDGSCWMTQNLDFDIPSTLSSKTSNVNTDNFATDITRVSRISDWNDQLNGTANYNYNAYYDPGDYFYNGPADNPHGASIGSTWCSLDGTTNANTNLGDCAEFSAVGQDMHYHIGNYYSYSAITLKSGNYLDAGKKQEPAFNICPKGWSLPAGVADVNPITFSKLFSEYGFNGKLTSANGDYKLYDDPLYLVFGGFLYNKHLAYAVYSGYYRTSSPQSLSSGASYNLELLGASDNKYRVEAFTDQRQRGYSARCVFIP